MARRAPRLPRTRVLAYSLVAYSVVACALVACSSAPSDGAEARARAIEARLMAPCCWAQTLDVHESPITPGLRAEILRRVRAGESSEAIEEDFVARYGEQVLAVPHGAMTPEAAATPIVLLFLLGSAVVISRLVRRRSDTATSGSPPAPSAPDEMDRRLDDELERMDQRLD